MNIEFIKLNCVLFFVEYFIVIILIFLLIVYSLIINNIFGILTQKIVSTCLSFIYLLVGILVLNDSLFFLIDLNINSLVNFDKLIVFDYLAGFSKLMISFLSFIFFIIISELLNDYKLMSLEFFLLLLFNILGLVFLCSSYDLLLIFISIELVSLSSYFLVALKKKLLL